MKKLQVKVHLSIGYANAGHDDILELEVDDDATQEDIDKQVDEMVNDWANNYIDLGWSIL